MPTYRLRPGTHGRNPRPLARLALTCECCAASLGEVYSDAVRTGMAAALAIALWPEMRQRIKSHEKECRPVELPNLGLTAGGRVGANGERRWQAMARLRARGMTLEEIGRHFGITRQAVHHSLCYHGQRLAGVDRRRKPPLSLDQIHVWATAFARRYGHWPDRKAGLIDGTTETWSGVDDALRRGLRGLPGGSSLMKLLRTNHPS